MAKRKNNRSAFATNQLMVIENQMAVDINEYKVMINDAITEVNGRGIGCG